MFREIGLADELGSGMRNTYKYTQLYSGGEPQFVEGDVFHTIIPLCEANAIVAAGSSSVLNTGNSTEAATEAATEAEIKLSADKLNSLLAFCSVPRTRAEMQLHCNIKTEKYFRENILKPMLTSGLIKRTIPEKPKSPKQKYIRQ